MTPSNISEQVLNRLATWAAQYDLSADDALNRLLDLHTKHPTSPTPTIQQHEMIFQHMLDGYALHEIILDESGTPIDYRFLDINPAFELYTGLTRDIIGKTIREVLPSIEQRWIDAYGQVALMGEPIHFENFSGAVGDKWFDVVAFRPTPGQFVTIFHDITERKLIDESLRFIAQLGWQSAGGTFFEVLATHLAEALGMAYCLISEFVAEADPPQIHTVAFYAKGHIRDNIVYDVPGTPCETVAGQALCYYPRNVQQQFPLDKDLVELGAECYVGIPLWDSQGTALGLISVMDTQPLDDVRRVSALLQIVAVRAAHELERMRDEKILRERETMLEGIFRAVPVGIILAKERMTQWTNKAYIEMTGYDEAEIIGQEVRFLYPTDEEYQRVGHTLYSQMADGSATTLESQIKRKDGRVIDILARATYLDPTHPEQGVIASAQDITERKRVEAQIRQRQEELEALLHIASAVGSIQKLDLLLDTLLEHLETLVPYDTVSIMMVDDKGDLRFGATRGIPDHVDLSIIEDAINKTEHWQPHYSPDNPHPVLVPDVTQTDWWIVVPGMEYVRCWMGVPLIHQGQLQGLLNLDHSEAGFFNEHHERLTMGVARQVATALATARYVADLEQLVAERTAELRRSEEHYRLVSDMTSDYVYITSLTSEGVHRLEWASGAFQQITSYTPEEVQALATGWLEIIHPDDHNTAQEIAARLLAGEAITNEYRIITKDGKIRMLRDHINPTWDDEQQRIVGLVGAVKDITIEKRAEAALLAEKEQTEAILRHVTDAIVFTDPNEHILYVNPAWEQQTGYTLAEAQGYTPFELLGHRDTQSIFDNLHRTVKQGTTWMGLINLKHRDGTSYDCELVVAPIRDEAGNILNFVGVQHNVTEARKLAALKEQFIANAAHDLGNPVASLQMQLSLLRLDPLNQEQHIAGISRQVERLEALIKDLLMISRLDRGIVTLDVSPLDLNQLVNHILADQAVIAENQGIDLVFAAGDTPAMINADMRQMERVIVNLVANALNYTHQGGQVQMTTLVQDGAVLLRISDTGVGIPPDDLPFVFDRFYRGKKVDKFTTGTGLGLAIAKQIVELHGGSVQAESVVNKGTIITVHLPALLQAALDRNPTGQ